MVVQQDLAAGHCILTVTLPIAELRPKLDSELKRFRQRAQLKGFRQGQAPMPFVKKMYGTHILADTVSETMSNDLVAYMRESKMEVLGQPIQIKEERTPKFNIDKPDEEYVSSYEVGFVPTFEVKGLDAGQTFERLTISDLDELASQDLAQLRTRLGERTHPEDNIEEGDILKIQATEVDGEWMCEMVVMLRLVKSEKLRSQLLEMKKGEHIHFNARELEEFSSEELYRKYMLTLPDGDERTVGDWFNGEIVEVTRQQKAALDSEFFQKAFGEELPDEAAAIEKIKPMIASHFLGRANALLMRDFQLRLLELNKIDLPEEFLKKWLALRSGEISPEQVEKGLAGFLESMRWSLISDRIVDDYGIEVTDAEIRREYSAKVRQYFKAELPDHMIAETVNRLMADKKDVDKTRKELEVDKLFECVSSFVTIVDKPIPHTEFQQLFESINQRANAEQAEGNDLLDVLEAE